LARGLAGVERAVLQGAFIDIVFGVAQTHPIGEVLQAPAVPCADDAGTAVEPDGRLSGAERQIVCAHQTPPVPANALPA
jgi:hypothetical protein